MVNARAVFEHQPMEDWWSGSSRQTEEKKSGERWALDVFGMSVNQRLNTGECSEAHSIEEAVNILVDRIQYNRRIVGAFRDLTETKIQEVSSRLNLEYNTLHQHLLRYTETQEVGELMGVQSALWRMAYKLPPTKRARHIRSLASFLFSLNLKRDGLAMLHLFLSEE